MAISGMASPEGVLCNGGTLNGVHNEAMCCMPGCNINEKGRIRLVGDELRSKIPMVLTKSVKWICNGCRHRITDPDFKNKNCPICAGHLSENYVRTADGAAKNSRNYEVMGILQQTDGLPPMCTNCTKESRKRIRVITNEECDARTMKKRKVCASRRCAVLHCGEVDCKHHLFQADIKSALKQGVDLKHDSVRGNVLCALHHSAIVHHTTTRRRSNSLPTEQEQRAPFSMDPGFKTFVEKAGLQVAELTADQRRQWYKDYNDYKAAPAAVDIEALAYVFKFLNKVVDVESEKRLTFREINEKFDALFVGENHLNVQPRYKRYGQLLDVVAGKAVPEGIVYFYPRVYTGLFKITNWSLRNSRRMLSQWAESMKFCGAVWRRLTVDGQGTWLELRVDVFDQTRLQEVGTKLRDNGAEFEWDESTSFDPIDESFTVHTSGPRRIDGIDSADSESVESFNIAPRSTSYYS